MKKTDENKDEHTKIDKLIEQITIRAVSGDEVFRAFLHAFDESITLPCDGFVIGEPVSVIGFGYDGNERRGLTTRCRRQDGSEHVVAACDVTLSEHASGKLCLAAYRQWLGLEPEAAAIGVAARRKPRHKVTEDDLDLSRPIELVVLSVKERAARCRLLKTDRIVTLRAGRLWDIAPGEIATVMANKLWSYAGHTYLSGEIALTQLDVSRLDLVPLKLEDHGDWNPDKHYWGEEDEPIDDWAKPIIARGPRRMFEMEQVLPGRDLEDLDPDSDPICQANDLKDGGDTRAAITLLMELCEADLRCLDAHAHLGNIAFDRSADDAMRHYEVGLRIGELSLGADFEGLLPWGQIDNRPFLRCMHGFGLCLWRLGRFEEAEQVFARMLWLNPSDNQGARFLLRDVRLRKAWEDRQEDSERA